MRHSISWNTRRELTHLTKHRYQKATDAQKSSLLDAFTAATAYHRKYAVTLLSEPRIAPDKKNDPCFVEQKNGSVVRRGVGYSRQEGERGVRLRESAG